jgi:predicted Rossmann fold nucleotide-binding protein DprA/Smf involved in DNA uptake
LIRQGATLVTSVEEVLDDLAPMLRDRLEAARQRAEAAALGPIEQRLLSTLSVEGATVDRVVVDTGLAPGVVLETLLALELRGLVAQRPGMRFAARRAA